MLLLINYNVVRNQHDLSRVNAVITARVSMIHVRTPWKANSLLLGHRLIQLYCLEKTGDSFVGNRACRWLILSSGKQNKIRISEFTQ